MQKSTKIDPSVIKKILKLSKLDDNPSDETLENYGLELDSILKYVEELKEVDTSMVKATDIIPIAKINELREDETNSNTAKYQKTRKNIINNFPKKQGDLLVLPIKVVE